MAFVNTMDKFGDDKTLSMIIERSITEYCDDSATTIRNYAFHSCTALVVVDLPNVTTIYAYAFHGCSALSVVNLPAVTSVGQYAFQGCDSPFDLSLPAVTSVGQYAFFRCAGVKKLRLPKCTSIGLVAFQSTSNLTAIILENTETVCTLASTNVFNTSSAVGGGTGYIYVPSALVDSYKNATNWSTYKEQFRGIFDDEDVLQGIANGTLVNLQSNKITSIPNYGCYNYTALESVSSDSATEVGKSAFQNCTSLSSIDLPAVTKINSKGFNGCTSLTTVNVPELTGLYGYEFAGCTNLVSAKFPSVTLTNCGGYGPFASAGVEIVDFPVLSDLKGYLFYSANSLKTVILRNSAVCALSTPIESVFALTSFPTTGYIYVPSALVDSYKVATNWSEIADRFRALEDYTVDGTVTGEFDPYKNE